MHRSAGRRGVRLVDADLAGTDPRVSHRPAQEPQVGDDPQRPRLLQRLRQVAREQAGRYRPEPCPQCTRLPNMVIDFGDIIVSTFDSPWEHVVFDPGMMA